MPGRLEPNVIRNLVQVRGLLDRAVEETRQVAEYRRTTGIVLLDAVNERVLYEATTHLNMPVRREFSQQLDDLAAALGRTWDSGGLSNVRRLHRARNTVQHEGLGVDRDDIEPFIDATRTFVSAVVSTVFDMNIWRMSRGFAIASDWLAQPFFEAELALERQDAEECVRSLGEVLDRIRERTTQFAGESRGWRTQPRGLFGTRNEGDAYLDARLNEVEDLAVFSSLGADASRVLWFQRLTREAAAATLEEAERALGYVFWWVAAFESSPVIDDSNRQLEWEVRQRKVRDTAERAHIHSVDAGAPEFGMIDMKIALADVPDTFGFDAWQHAMSSVLTANPVWSSVRVYLDNTATLHAAVPDDVDLRQLRDELDRVLAQTEEVVVQRRTADEATRIAHEDARAAFQAGVEASGHILPDWVADVRLVIGEGYGPPEPSVGFRITPRFGGNMLELANALNADPRVEQIYHSRTWQIEPVMPVTELAEVLDTVTHLVVAWAEGQAYRDETTRQQRQHFLAAFGDVAVSADEPTNGEWN